MRTDVKQLWVTALREPNRKQTHDQLFDGEDGRCVLGILCDIYMNVTGMGRWDTDPPSFVLGAQRYSYILPSEVAAWAELGIAEQGILGQMNDGMEPDEGTGVALTAGVTLTEIADFIENTW